MQRYDSTRQAWEDIWDAASIEVENKAVRYPRSLATIHAYIPYLPQDAPILEAGSGLSAVVMLLREMGYDVIGLDYAINALHASRAYDPTLRLLAGDVHHLPCADNSLGAYLSFGVLEHFEQGMGPALAEAYRVLQPGGVLVLTIPYPNLVHRLLDWRRGLRGESLLNNDDFYESTYTRHQLVETVTAAGFTLCTAQAHQPRFHALGPGRPLSRPRLLRDQPAGRIAGRPAARGPALGLQLHDADRGT